MRTGTSAALGALAAVAGWVTWSMLGTDASPAPALPAGAETAAIVPAPAAPTVRDAPSMAVAHSAPPPASVPATPARPPTLRDGLVMEHGLATAVHAGAGDGAQAPVPPAIALPAGSRAEDAVVNGAGMVALTRSADAPSTTDAAAATAARPATAIRAP